MKIRHTGALGAAAAAALTAAMLQPATAAPVAMSAPQDTQKQVRPDNRPGPLSRAQATKKAKALELVEAGKAKIRHQADGSTVVRVGAASRRDPSAFVELGTPEKTDSIWTVLSQFGGAGPAHNEIVEPDRSVDNSTVWKPDFDKAYYDETFNGSSNESMKGFYREQSAGKYTVDVTTEDWVTVPQDGAYYGANPHEDEGGSWDFINDTVDAWYADAVAKGMSEDAIKAKLASLDTWDRYDFDGDGNFDEPDGYIDHFQAVHAGEGEEGNGGPDAIWSHRWYVGTGYGSTGPTVGGKQNLGGGAEIGDTGFYIGDYTVEPENGGLGVFAHEFGHDLGLPDFYDTAGGENSTAFWTLMSSGSWLSYGDPSGIGTHAGGFGPDEKYFLGWLKYSEVNPGEQATPVIGPSAHQYDGAEQAVKVNLPDATVTNGYTSPPQGQRAWWSGTGDDLTNTLTLATEVPQARAITVSASANYAIEKNYDYLYAQYSTGGSRWTNAGAVTGTTNDKWTNLKFTYKPTAPTRFRFVYKTDGGVAEMGAFLDEITVKAGKSVVSTTDAETAPEDWTAKGFTRSTGTEMKTAAQYYWLESRQYVGADATLENGPYQFDKGYTAPNHVEHFGFQNGMLVWFQDKRFADNNTIDHVGYGQSLPVDAVPAKFTYEGTTAGPSNRRQPFDATFGLDTVDPVCLHREVLVGHGKNQAVQTQEACAPTGRQQSVFNDSDPNRYWSSSNPLNSTKVAGAGVSAQVTGDDNGFLTVHVFNPPVN